MSGEQVYVAGGANSAGQAVVHLAHYARCVRFVVRAASLDAGMSHYLVRQIEATPNVEVRTETEVVDGGGDGWLEHLVPCDRAGHGEEKVNAGAIFLMIGARPHTEWLPSTVERDSDGFIRTGPDLSARRVLGARSPPAGAGGQPPGSPRSRGRPPRIRAARGVRGR